MNIKIYLFDTGGMTVEPEKIIAMFLKWLHENPSIFQPQAWQDLPKLAAEIAESADDELFPIAMTISKWCAKHGLGETLKECVLRKDCDDAGDPTPTAIAPLTNITQTLGQEIEEAYQKLQATKAETRSNSNNDSK